MLKLLKLIPPKNVENEMGVSLTMTCLENMTLFRKMFPTFIFCLV